MSADLAVTHLAKLIEKEKHNNNTGVGGDPLK